MIARRHTADPSCHCKGGDASGGSIFEKMKSGCAPATGRDCHPDRGDFTFCGHRLSSLFRSFM